MNYLRRTTQPGSHKVRVFPKQTVKAFLVHTPTQYGYLDGRVLKTALETGQLKSIPPYFHHTVTHMKQMHLTPPTKEGYYFYHPYSYDTAFQEHVSSFIAQSRPTKSRGGMKSRPTPSRMFYMVMSAGKVYLLSGHLQNHSSNSVEFYLIGRVTP